MTLSLQESKIAKAVSLILSLATERKEGDVFDGELPVQMQISVKRIPKESSKTRVQLKFPHSLAKPGDDICLFVKDLNKTERDTEPTVAFYKDLLAEKGVKNVLEIVPVTGLKTDFLPYEAKKNLSNSYDWFLADERVVACLPRLLGKSFYARKRAPTQINVRAANLKGEIDRALCKNKFDFSVKGTSSMALVGHSGMTQSDLTENVKAAIDQISASIPGSCVNIRQLSIKARSCTSVPIYISTEGGPQDIKLEKPKRKRVKVEVDELSSLPDAKVAVYPDGKVLVIREGQTLKEAILQDRKSHIKSRAKTKDTKVKGKVGKKASKKSTATSSKKKSPKKSKKIK